LNVFAEVGQERNGVFFSAGANPGANSQGDNSTLALDALAFLGTGQDNASAPSGAVLGGPPVQKTVFPTPIPALEHVASTSSQTVVTGTPPQHALSVYTLDRFFADWGGSLTPDGFGDGTAFSWAD
jgi:hypothetical protein